MDQQELLAYADQENKIVLVSKKTSFWSSTRELTLKVNDVACAQAVLMLQLPHCVLSAQSGNNLIEVAVMTNGVRNLTQLRINGVFVAGKKFAFPGAELQAECAARYQKGFVRSWLPVWLLTLLVSLSIETLLSYWCVNCEDRWDWGWALYQGTMLSLALTFVLRQALKKYLSKMIESPH